MMATKWTRTTSTSTSTPSNHHHHRHTRWLFVVLALVVLLNAAANAIVPVAGSPSVRSASKSVVGSAVTDGDSPKSGDSTDSNAPGVERFYFEHKIGDKEAAAAFNTLADELINKPTPAWCQECSPTIVTYCLDRRMLQDHCCCDSSHARDQLPWLPHTCYVGDNCKPNMRSCMQYTEVRECCCDRIMAKQWRAIRSDATRSRSTTSAVAAAIGMIFGVLANVR